MTKRTKNLYVNASLWYIVANVLGQGIVFLSNIVFTRIMSKTDYGMYSTYYSIVAMLTPFVGANLFVGLCNGYYDFKDDRLNFRGSVFFLSILVFICFSSVFLLTQRFVLPLFNIQIPALIGIFTLIHAYSFFVLNYYNNFANMENRYKIKSVLMFLQNFLQVVISILLILIISKNSYIERVVGSASAVLGCAMVLGIIMLLRCKKIFNKKYYSYALKLSVPSVFSSIAYMIMQQSDHLMITSFVGADYTAVYSLLFIVGNAMYAFLQAAGGAYQSWIYKALDENNVENVKIIQKWYLYFFMLIAIGLLMVSPEVIKLLFPSSYWDFRYIPPFVASSSLVVIVNMYTNVAEFNKKQRIVSLCVLFAATINVVLNIIFIQLYGALAAAYTSLTAYAFLVLFIKFVVRKLNKQLYSDKLFILYFVAILFACGIFIFLGDIILLRYIVFSILLIGLLIYCVIKKKEIFNIIGINR